MKRGGTRWTVQWSGDGEPGVGHLVRHVTATGKESFVRVRSVRLVRHRKPLPPGYNAVYAVIVERLPDRQQCEPIAWTLKAWPRKKKPAPSIEHDRFSPLL